MIGRNHGNKERHIRHREPDPGGSAGRGGSIGAGLAEAHGVNDTPNDAGRVRPTIAELRAAAQLARDRQPTSTRYTVWALGSISGQPHSEIERMRLLDVPYYVEFLRTKKVPYGDR